MTYFLRLGGVDSFSSFVIAFELASLFVPSSVAWSLDTIVSLFRLASMLELFSGSTLVAVSSSGVSSLSVVLASETGVAACSISFSGV